VDDGREGISLICFELWDRWELLFRKVVPVHPGADRATAEVLLDLAIVRTRWRFRSFSFLVLGKQKEFDSKHNPTSLRPAIAAIFGTSNPPTKRARQFAGRPRSALSG
jgi:hypothetical protein